MVFFCLDVFFLSSFFRCSGWRGSESCRPDFFQSAYYPFDRSARDISGNNNHGLVMGASTAESGYEGWCYSFNGDGAYIEIPVNINPEFYPQLTMEAWVKPNSASPVRQVISHDNGNFDRSLGIDYRGGGEGWSAFCGNGVLGFEPVILGEWVFLAVVYDQSAETVKLYVNDFRCLCG